MSFGETGANPRKLLVLVVKLSGFCINTIFVVVIQMALKKGL